MLDKIPLVDDVKIKTWRAIDGLLQGRLGQVLLPISDAQRNAGLSEVSSGRRPWSDTTYFSDGTGYVQFVSPATATFAASKNGVEITITYTGTLPQIGQYFSMGVRLYIITYVSDGTGQSRTIKFWPPLREAITAGQALKFELPNCLCRLANDTEMELALEMNQWATGKVNFVEDVGPIIS